MRIDILEFVEDFFWVEADFIKETINIPQLRIF
jgi:hypothetical protein